MGKERPDTADSFVKCKPPPGGPRGRPPPPESPPPSSAGRAARAQGAREGPSASPRPTGGGGRSGPSAPPGSRLELVHSGGGGRRGGELPAARGGGARAAGRRGRLTRGGAESRGAEQRAAERGQQAGAEHAVRSGRSGRARGALPRLLHRDKSGSAAPPPPPPPPARSAPALGRRPRGGAPRPAGGEGAPRGPPPAARPGPRPSASGVLGPGRPVLSRPDRLGLGGRGEGGAAWCFGFVFCCLWGFFSDFRKDASPSAVRGKMQIKSTARAGFHLSDWQLSNY